MAKRRGPNPPRPSPPRGNKKGAKNFGGYKTQDVEEFAKHAQEVKSLASGRDIVERKNPPREKRPPAFDRQQLQVVRSWVKSRPLEPLSPAAAMIAYPRMWTTKRGRYCKFKSPSAGAYGIIRSRPTF
ncbi:MAG: hypothetical protein R3C68_03860 [Myxococcota bacterium]